MALRTEAEQKAYREGVEAGSLRGVMYAVQLLRESGVPVAHTESLHEYIDFTEARNGDLKREPRSTKGKEAKRERTGPWQALEGGTGR